jgi:signal transduction histidine kinase
LEPGLSVPEKRGRELGDLGQRVSFALAACALLFAPTVAAADAKNILLLYSNNRLLPANLEVERGLYESIPSTPERPVEFYAEFLDVPRFTGTDYARSLTTFLQQKYARRTPDVIVVAGEEALAFLLADRAMLFPRVPVVHVGVQTSYLKSAPTLPADVIGVPVEYTSTGTIEQALRWHPGIHQLVIVTGSSPWDRQWETRLREEVSHLESHPTVEFLSALPTSAVLERLRALQGRAIVFTPGYFQDGTGRVFTPRQAIETMAASSTAPVYSASETFIGTGIVGGHVPSHRAMGRQAGHFVDEILRGASPTSLSVPGRPSTELHVDWRQAQRWGIRDGDIPADAVVHFRTPSLWEEHQTLVLVTIAVFLLQTGLIVALLFERKRRRRADAALHDTKKQMTLVSTAAGLSLWAMDVGQKKAVATERQRPSDTPTERAVDLGPQLDAVYPADRPALENAIRQALASEKELDVEYRVVQPDGPPRWLALRGGIERGNTRRLLGVAIDITARKAAELQASKDRTALRHMTRISILGQLSASIAHQLNQPLAAILSNAETAQELLSKPAVDLVELRAICDDIVAEDHRAADVIAGLRSLFKRDELNLKPLDMNALVRETLTLMQTDLMLRQVTPVTELAPRLPVIEGDRVQLQQVLLNLVVNAADAMSGSETPGKKLTIRTDMAGVDVRVRVSDSGPGIADGDFKTLFDAFWSTKPDGIGIGLAICQSIVATHRGRLTATNNPEGGATFSATFPVGAST